MGNSTFGAVSNLQALQLNLVAWAMRKFKRLKGHKTRASLFLESMARSSRTSSNTGSAV